MKIESLKLLVNRIRRADLGDRPVDLKVVVVHNDAEIVQPVVAGKHGCLPDLAFLQLAVTQQRVDPVAVLGKLCGQCHTDRCRDALSQGS